MVQKLFRTFVALFIPFSVAHASPVANVDISTLGPGVNLQMPISRVLAFRIGLNHWHEAQQGVYTGNNNSIGYDGYVRLQSLSLLVDYAPWAGTFHLTAGAIRNNNEISATGVPDASGNYTVDGGTYSASVVGTLTGHVAPKHWASYLGFGWGSNPAGRSGLSLGADLGVMFQGSPEVQLTASNPTNSAQVAAAVTSAQQTAQQHVDKYRYYPVAGVSVGYRF
ncbi:MAG: hypothetical protein ACYCRH_00035 [Acidiferrobacteraceae bacterium]